MTKGAIMELEIAFLAGLFLAGVAAVWVFNDAKGRDKPTAEAAFWGILVFLFFILAFPAWLAVRPKKPGELPSSIPPYSPAEELQRFAQLRASGAISEEEYQAQKRYLLGPGSEPKPKEPKPKDDARPIIPPLR